MGMIVALEPLTLPGLFIRGQGTFGEGVEKRTEAIFGKRPLLEQAEQFETLRHLEDFVLLGIIEAESLRHQSETVEALFLFWPELQLDPAWIALFLQV